MGTGTFMDAPPTEGEELHDHAPELGDQFEPPAAFTGVSFASRVHNLMLTMQIGRLPGVEPLPGAGMSFPELEEHAAGIRRRISPGFRISFRGGYLSLTDDLRREWRDFLGRYGRFYFYDSGEQHDELTALAEVPLEDILRTHPQFGTANVDSFREIEIAIPAAAADLEKILDATLEGDEDALEALYEAELAGFKRPQVLEAAQKALEKLHERHTARPDGFTSRLPGAGPAAGEGG